MATFIRVHSIQNVLIHFTVTSDARVQSIFQKICCQIQIFITEHIVTASVHVISFILWSHTMDGHEITHVAFGFLATNMSIQPTTKSFIPG